MTGSGEALAYSSSRKVEDPFLMSDGILPPMSYGSTCSDVKSFIPMIIRRYEFGLGLKLSGTGRDVRRRFAVILFCFSRMIFICLVSGSCLSMAQVNSPSYASCNYTVARRHEIRPHHRTIPREGIDLGLGQLSLTLIVSGKGDVLSAEAQGAGNSLHFWPELEPEVKKWKFTPFQRDGVPVAARVQEVIDIVPPVRMPKDHVAAPTLRPDSMVVITLVRSGCFGICPIYTLSVTTNGVVFEGNRFVVAPGKHQAQISAYEVRKLAEEFVNADFYSMEPEYFAPIADIPSYSLSLAIDGHEKTVTDHGGLKARMPVVVSELEDEVDEAARSQRWIDGTDGLVQELQAEKFNFQSVEAQKIMKRAADRGETETVRQLLKAGVSSEPLPAPAPARFLSFEEAMIPPKLTDGCR
jgi:hypothetical protein